MGKVILVLVLTGFIGAVFGPEVLAKEVTWEDIGGGNLKIKSILIDPVSRKRIYFGSNSGVFKSEDGGRSWRQMLLLRGENRGVNFLAFAGRNSYGLYALCANGLYYSPNRGSNWQRIFKGKNSLENEGTQVARGKELIYLGTKGGLFSSNNGGRSWHKEPAPLGNSHIYAIAVDPENPAAVYVAACAGVFKRDKEGDLWQRAFVSSPTENDAELEAGEDDLDEATKVSDIRYLVIDPNHPNELYLATQKGVYKSRDKAASWELLSNYGLLSKEAEFLFISRQSGLFAVSASGVFAFRDARWYELSFNLADRISSLSADDAGNLYAAADKGLFRATTADLETGSQDSRIALYYESEPKIKDVQQAAIRYAEVDPKKILRWRKQAAKKAYLPKVTTSVGRNITDLWHWETGSTTRTDDDLLVKGDDAIEWDVSLSWDLSEIIWNDAQTSIDVRSRLLVQLRDDILDEVTKIYFERLRVKMELDNLAIEDRKKRFEKELKIEQLTASLDALTGGYFSQHLRPVKGS